MLKKDYASVMSRSNEIMKNRWGLTLVNLKADRLLLTMKTHGSNGIYLRKNHRNSKQNRRWQYPPS